MEYPENEWQKGTRKSSNQLNCNICTCSEYIANSGIAGAPKKKWMFVGRISGNDVDEDDVGDYL